MTELELGEKIAVLGLGYVGLPVALALAKGVQPGGVVIGFDVDEKRIEELRAGHDRTGEVDGAELREVPLTVSCDPNDLIGCTFYIVAVPTPVDQHKVPDLTPVERASQSVGRALAATVAAGVRLARPAIVVYESTVYPGVTEDVCGPILEKESGLQRGPGFRLGYSPERINPGDKEHSFERIIKVVSGEDPETLERVAAVYGSVVKAGVFRAASIKVAEAAKVIENTQRDINIALMNELAMIFDRLEIRTADVLAAAGTKWNFLPFKPGLVGGHCIGVDPYYLTTKAQALGYQPEVILAGRRINDQMGVYLAQRLVKLLIGADRPVKGAKVGVLGLTFKEDVPDLRNSRVPDILHELESFGVTPLIHDPFADPAEARHEYGVELTPLDAFVGLDALILAVPHRAYLDLGFEGICAHLADGGILLDVKSAFAAAEPPRKIRTWSL